MTLGLALLHSLVDVPVSPVADNAASSDFSSSSQSSHSMKAAA